MKTLTEPYKISWVHLGGIKVDICCIHCISRLNGYIASYVLDTFKTKSVFLLPISLPFDSIEISCGSAFQNAVISLTPR